MKICADCKLLLLLFFGAVHVGSRSSISNEPKLRLECLVALIWHFLRILRRIPQKSFFSEANAWWFFLRNQGVKIEVCFLVGKYVGGVKGEEYKQNQNPAQSQVNTLLWVKITCKTCI